MTDDAIRERFKPVLEGWLVELADLVEWQRCTTDGPWDDNSDGYLWLHLEITPPRAPTISVRFKVFDSGDFDGPGLGLAFSLEASSEEGMIAALTPGNFSEGLWIPYDRPDLLEERIVDFMEACPPVELLEDLLPHLHPGAAPRL